MPDHGPIYYETYLYLSSHSTHWLVEPYNAVTAAIFIFMAVYWLLRLKSLDQRHDFMLFSTLLLLVGGIGGTLYHATRLHSVFLLMDWAPIAILATTTSFFFTHKLTHHLGRALIYTAAGFGSLIMFFSYAGQLGLLFLGPTTGYIALALFVVAPMITYAFKTNFRHAIFLFLSLKFFVLGAFFRYWDKEGALPMGTHFLWHVMGALATHLLILYVWRVEQPRNSQGQTTS